MHYNIRNYIRGQRKSKGINCVLVPIKQEPYRFISKQLDFDAAESFCNLLTKFDADLMNNKKMIACFPN